MHMFWLRIRLWSISVRAISFKHFKDAIIRFHSLSREFNCGISTQQLVKLLYANSRTTLDLRLPVIIEWIILYDKLYDPFTLLCKMYSHISCDILCGNIFNSKNVSITLQLYWKFVSNTYTEKLNTIAYLSSQGYRLPIVHSKLFTLGVNWLDLSQITYWLTVSRVPF